MQEYRASDAPSIFSSDQTAEAAKVVASANEDLTKIKVLYKENEGKREEIKKALETDNAEDVKKLSDQVVSLINDGSENAKCGRQARAGGRKCR